MSKSIRRIVSAIVLLGASACDTPAAGPVDAGAVDAGPAPDWRECDPIVPTACGLPFPNDVYTTPDAESATGLRVRFTGRAVPRLTRTLAPFHALDGFSPASSPMTHMPGATSDGLPGPLEIARSLDDASPTVIVDLASGERVAHFAELDLAYDDDAERVLLLRPASSLRAGGRYAVAIRGVVDASGEVLPASPVFAALRDGAETDDPAVTERRAIYDALFADLESAGVARGSLQIAWSFTVGSRESITGRLVSMRDQALAMAGEDGPPYAIEAVEVRPDTDESIALRVRGTVDIPLFMTRADPGGTLRLAADGRPAADGVVTVPFWMLVPRSAASAPGQLLQWGHGLLGSGEEIFHFEALHAFAHEHRYVVFAVDWAGMASEDLGHIAGVAIGGDMGEFATVTDRLEQGILNALVAARAMRGAIAVDARIELAGVSPIDRSRPTVFVGQSQGGIFGATYLALSTDVERGVLLVPGQAYSLLLQRNRGGWDQFSPLFEQSYGPLDIQRCLALMQMLWDRAEPSGYTSYLRTDRIEGTPAHEVLMVVAINDHQVTTLGAHAMARSIGDVPNLAPANRAVWGLEESTAPHVGSAMIEIDFGVPDVPLTNTLPPEGTDPHTLVAEPPWVLETVNGFLQTGAVATTCDGPCDPR
jgi:hypothetical protein